MAEPTHIQGQRTTLNIDQGRRVPDVEDKIYILEPISTPLTAFLTQIGRMGDGGGNFDSMAVGKRTVYNPKFTEYEAKYSGTWAKINNGAGYLTSDTAFVVDTPGAQIFTKYDVVKNYRTGEVYRVTSVNYTTNTITVVRAQGSVSAAVINDNDDLMIIGNAFEEGAKSGDINTTELIEQVNYTQIFRTKVGATGTHNASKTLPGQNPGADLKTQRAVQAIEHAKKIERAYLFGEKKEVSAGPDGKPLRYTGGLLEGIVGGGNVQDESSSSLTSTEWRSFLANYAFVNGSPEKYFLCGNTILSYLESFYAGQMHYVPNDKTFGVNIRKVQTPFGILNLVSHPMLTGVYAGMGIVLDLDTVKHAVLNKRDTALKLNVQDNDADSEEDEWITESGLMRVNMEKNAILKGVA